MLRRSKWSVACSQSYGGHPAATTVHGVLPTVTGGVTARRAWVVDVINLRRLGCGCGRRLVTGSRVIHETTQTDFPWSRQRISLSIYLYPGSKFESSCGWPAFDKSVGGSVRVQTDFSLGRVRSEIVCAGCGGHLGRACTRSLQPERPGDPAVNSTDTTDAPAPPPGAAQTCLAAKPTRPRMSGIASTRWRCSMIGSHCLQGLRRSRS